MGSFVTITPTRSERPEFLEFCKHQLSRMTVKPDKSYFVDYKPTSSGFDLVERVKQGVVNASKDGYDLVFIIEEDDFYPANYFERFQPYFPDFHFFGQDYSIYYNLKNQTHNRFDHGKGNGERASLFTTGFKISALNNFDWPDNSKPFLDLRIWEYARHKKRKWVDTGAIGIKHGLGLCGGKGHKMEWPRNYDKDMHWLRKSVDAESFEFYRSIANKLQLQPV